MDDSWETFYFGSIDAVNGGAGDDWDGDGCLNLTESRAGTDPTDPDSVFRITEVLPTAGSVEVSWSSESDRTYTLQCSTSLTDGSWTDVATGLVATPPTNSYTHESINPAAFYRVKVE